MVLTLYGLSRPVGSTAAVAMTLIEKQIPFQFVAFDLAALAHQAPEHLTRNPFGEVPVIDDDGFILYESRAICRYLIQKYSANGPQNLVPTELKAKARFEQAASIEFGSFQPHARAVYFEALVNPERGIPKDQVVFDQEVAALSAKLDVYEVILGKQKFLAGDEFTLADLFHVSSGCLLEPAGCDLLTTTGPNVARWWNEIVSRPSWFRMQEGIQIISAY
ncbi:glutathione S-transferase [Mycena epipterygia]|nr:glutathione S-transferase [Mycena epipterygia]